jgi:ATP-binding cassette subfamily B protein
MAKFPFYKQADAMDCGPTCIKMIAKFYRKSGALPVVILFVFLTKNKM